jgi:hypothetical protein
MQLIGHHYLCTKDLCHLNKQEELCLLNGMKFTAKSIMLVIVIQRVLISKSDVIFFNSLQLIVAVSPLMNRVVNEEYQLNFAITRISKLQQVV